MIFAVTEKGEKMFRTKVECEHCHNELDYVEVDYFDHEGADHWEEVNFDIHENGIFIDLSFNWCGHEFDDDDADKGSCIRCPECHKYPFKDREIQTYEFDRVIMFFGERREDE